MLNKEELIKRMQQGGLIFYFRHASTEKDYADQTKADVNDGSTQRVLSEKGWHEAVQIGKAIRYYNIPVGDVMSSDYFRAWQTAWLAFGKYEKNSDFNFLPFENYTENQIDEMKLRVTPYLCRKPLKNKNNIIVAHDDPFEAATGIYPKPQGVCYVIKPINNKSFQILGRIGPKEW
ncbi:MAG: histidine phosphatase family protein [Opitutae bacterium]|nr:histidine phosphatase family protein [Opitutae bacterium]|tara:strand:- start:2114 stop:2641 length:528 start_codon:yes stop_codon:yes gene_type:complete